MTSVNNPGILRLLLFGGLVLHKSLWEALKRGSRNEVARASVEGRRKRLIKTGKALSLFLLVVQTLFLNILPIGGNAKTLRILGTILYAIGLVTAMLGRLHLGRNWKDIEDLVAAEQRSLSTKGLYGYIRHPIYAGDMLLLVGLELALNSWLVLVMVIPILVFTKQALTEEVMLARRFPEYTTYCRQTKRFVPFII